MNRNDHKSNRNREKLSETKKMDIRGHKSKKITETDRNGQKRKEKNGQKKNETSRNGQKWTEPTETARNELS